jgi:diguanylate cyclase (GGDEF)-like protein
MAKAKIMLVEDNKTQAAIIRDFLDVNGYQVTWVESGMAAFKAAKTEEIDLILLDRVLPDIDGNDVCRWLKLDQMTRGIPIIMLSNKDLATDRIAGLEAGAEDYLPKPFDESELIARIYARLRSKSHQDELHQKNRQLEHMLTRVESLAIIDPLTGLFNRRRFESILSNEFKRAVRYRNPLSCIMIDIDHFKKINDVHGHKGGDLVLREIAHLIQASIREVDTAARWGNEEFVVLSPNISKENARLAAERIMKAAADLRFTDLGEERITVSIGIAGLPDPLLDTEEKLIHHADIALRESKRTGRNRVETN